MRQLATIKQIQDIRPIPGADAIEVAIVDGWECVIAKKDNFQVGDLIIYIEIDSVMPQRPEFEFLASRKYRIRTIKLRKQVSQGLVLSLSYLPPGDYTIGQDVTEIMGVTKYDPQAAEEMEVLKETVSKEKNPIIKWLMRFSWFREMRKTQTRSNKGFPTLVSKTDETRIENIPQLLKNKGIVWDITEKIDGQSATYLLRKTRTWYGKQTREFIVCSRNWRLPKPDNSTYWTIAQNQKIQDQLEQLLTTFNWEWVAIQGEIFGPAVQGNKYGLDALNFRVFNLITPLEGRLNSSEGKIVLEHCTNLQWVPFLYQGIILPDTVEEIRGMLPKTSLISNKIPVPEGAVFRSRDGKYSFKSVNPAFLLKFEE